MRDTILVIDDESSMQRLLQSSLESNGYFVKIVNSGSEALETVHDLQKDIAAILLDLGLPDIPGMEVLKRMRSQGIKTPILVLTVLDDDTSKVTALDCGADDYLTKPFSIPELLARVRVGIRHSGNQPQNSATTIKAGEIEIDIQTHQVRINGQEIKLTPLEFEILALLGRNLGKVVTHRVLLNKIWGPNSIDQVQYLRVHLGQVRKKLKEHNVDDQLVTESGVGYRLLANN